MIPKLEALTASLKEGKGIGMGETVKKWALNLGAVFLVGVVAAVAQALQNGQFDTSIIGASVAAGLAAVIPLLKQSPVPPKE